MAAPLRNPVPPPPANEMARLNRAGFSLIPLGGGASGKSPLLSFKGQPKLQLGRVLGPMHSKGSACYGLLLDGLAVIDCDEFDLALIQEMETRFGLSLVQVRTPRGIHLYYRYIGGVLPNLRGEGLPVDIKRNASSYVVGPHSVRPDGGFYDPLKGVLGADDLPVLSLPKSAREISAGGKIPEGSRNKELTTAAIRMVEYVDDPDELFGNLQFIRDSEIEDPITLPDSELRKIAKWVWSKRLESNVYHGRNSEFRIHREALDALKGKPNASAAIALFVTLQAIYGHVPGIAFALNHQAMRDSGHTDLSRRRFFAARKTLEDEGLLRVARRHRAGHSSRLYQLSRARTKFASLKDIVEEKARKKVS